jgi:F-box and leucine-rich repeat protein 2/20
MEMPLLLPAELDFCKRVDSEEALQKLLLRHPPDLISFLEIACADETWADAHETFMHDAISWVHQQFFQDQLMIEFAYRLAVVFRRHPSIGKLHLPNNVTLKLQDVDLPINTLMYGSSSQYLKDLVRLECRDRKSDCIYLKDVPFTVVEPIHEYIMKGYSDSLYVKDKDIGEAVLKLAQLWDLKEFIVECQQALQKWITRDNVLDQLLNSHKKGWIELRSGCYEYINHLEWDVRLLDTPAGQFKFEFLRFSENSLQLFDRLRQSITHLVFGGNIPEQPEFSQVVNRCPKLIGLDLSYTHEFTEYFRDIPNKLEELDLVTCPWINKDTLSSMAAICPKLLCLNVAANPQLNYQCWMVLQKFKHLQTLSLARCGHITDEDLRIVLQSCETLHALNLEECRNITDKAFSEIPRLNSRLMMLNVSRTNISDLALIEIMTHSYDLSYLNLTRCENISDKGVLEAVRYAKKLRELVIVNTSITPYTVQAVKKIKPFLEIIAH